MELKEQLEALAVKLEGKAQNEVKEAIIDFAAKNEEALELATKAVKEEMLLEMKKIQDHADALDVKLQAKEVKDAAPADGLKAFVHDNFEKLSSVGGTVKASFDIDEKAMTLGGNLTGDQPRTYRSQVADIPSPLVSFRELVPVINIGNGTLTFPRETGNTGTVATQVEGASKAELETSITMIDVNTDFLAGFTTYSKKMRNNLPFLESWLPSNLRRKYLEAENAQFYTTLSTAATASTLTAGNVVERIVNEQTTLLAKNFVPNAIVVNAADYGKILLTAGATGGTAGTFSLPGVVSIINGIVAINGIMVYVAPWVPADKYIIGEWSNTSRVETQGLSLNFSEESSDNFIKNNITARIEAQIALAIFRPDAFIFGDFTTVA